MNTLCFIFSYGIYTRRITSHQNDCQPIQTSASLVSCKTSGNQTMATSSDLDVLIDMGFDRTRAELAVKKSGGCKCFPSYLV